MEEKYIKALSSIVGIRGSKLNEFKETGDVYTILDRPNVINPTESQLEKIHLLNELKINLNISRDFRHKLKIDFGNSYEAGIYFKHLIGSKKDREIFLLAMFDKDNNLMKIKKISEGTIDATLVPPREILKCVIEHPKCKSILFCHNHPSGVPTPSDEDINVTNNLVNILEPLKIMVRDHIIVGDTIFSFQENGLVNNKNYELKVAENHWELTTQNNNYYEQHLKKYINALTGLVGINREKLLSYIEQQKEKIPNRSYHANIYLRLIENPTITASILGLNNAQRKKLEDIAAIMDSLNAYVKRDVAQVRDPGHMGAYARTYLNQHEIKNNNLYIMLFDTKNRVIGFEKLSYREGDNLVYNTRDILLKALSYEAKSVSIIMTAEEGREEGKIVRRNGNLNNFIDILQNSINILKPIQINVIDGLYINGETHFSMAEKDLLPNNIWGQPEYKKEIVFTNSFFAIEEVKKEEADIIKDLECEEEWEMEL